MVIGMMTVSNERSRRILLDVGYERVGSVTGLAVKNGTLIDMEIWQFPIRENWSGLTRLRNA